MIFKLFMFPCTPRTLSQVGALVLSSLVWACLSAAPARGYVFLDTSTGSAAPTAPAPPVPTPDSIPAKPGLANAPSLPTAAAAPDATRPVRPEGHHFKNVLFLSADNMLVYAYIGVLRALEEYRVPIDLVLAESKAVAVGGAWALGYPPRRIEKIFLETPLRSLVRPFPEGKTVMDRFAPSGPDPLQYRLALDFSEGESVKDAARESPGEFLHLGWMLARLTHDAPGGPVADLQATPRRLAVQVSDLVSGRPLVLTDGDLQGILKGSLLPKEIVRERPRLRHYASGSLQSGHAVLPDQPFAFDHLLAIEPGRRLRPPPLESVASGTAGKPDKGDWTDSLSQRILSGATERAAAPELAGKTVRLELNPESWFDPQSEDPQEWIELGYTSALKSMDGIRASLQASDSAAPAPAATARAGIQRLDFRTGTHLINGGSELLVDILKEADETRPDSTGNRAISELVRSGYYSGLDMEWQPGETDAEPALVFEAREQTRILIRAGGNLAFVQEELPARGPEAGAGITWSEPFYVPFQADVAAVLGGRQPGGRIKAMVAPVTPFPMELAISRAHWEIDYRTAPKSLSSLDPLPVRRRRDLTRLSLGFSPRPALHFIFAGERHEMSIPSGVVVEHDEDADEFLSNDFEQQTSLRFGEEGPSGLYRNSLWLRGRYLSRVNLSGTVKDPYSSLEARLRLSLGDFRFLNQYYWSSQKLEDLNLYDVLEMGRIAALGFQDEFFAFALRGPRFQNAQIEYAPRLGNFGLRAVGGGFALLGRKLTPERAERPVRGYWELQAAYATPLGPLRAGVGGLDRENPIVFLRFGADVSLEEDAPPP